MKLQCSLKLIYFHQESEPPTLPHTTAISLTPHSQSVSGLIRYKNLICQIREGRNVRGTAEAAGESTAGAGLGTGNGAGLVQHPLPCARGFPQAGTAGTIPTAPPAVPGEEDGPRARGQLSPPCPARLCILCQTHSRESSALPTPPRVQNSPPGQPHPPTPPNPSKP